MTESDLQKAYRSPFTLHIKGRLMEITRPLVMGILNLTPDSFYSPSRIQSAEDAVKRVRAMLDEGADIIDVGACSTRPGSEPVSAEEELQRLEAPLSAIRDAFPEAIVSLDTFRASVADESIKRWKVDIINDISGGADSAMFETVGRHKVPYILMHMRGTPADMDSHCDYGDDVVADVVRELAFRLDTLRQHGVADVIVDPGFGFAKNTEQNLRLLSHLDYLKVLGCPILAGISRKRMVREAGECDASDAMVSTVALNSVALMKGASIIRVHDVREGVQTAKTIYKLCLASE